jgi:hypothetical protein
LGGAASQLVFLEVRVENVIDDAKMRFSKDYFTREHWPRPNTGEKQGSFGLFIAR